MNEPDEPTRRVRPEDHDTSRQQEHDPTAVLGSVPPERGETGHAEARPEDGEEEPAHNRLREIAIGIGGAVFGFALAFVIVALSTSAVDDPAVTGGAAELEQAEATIAERDARIAELEAELAEADAAAGDRDGDLAAQREALEERSVALDDREQALDDREAALAEREAAVAAREEAVEQAEQGGDAGEAEEGDTGGQTDPGDGGDGGIDLPDVDGEEVSNAIEQLLERIRGLFGS